MNEKDPIERELRNALSVDPSPGFQDRVRAHVYRQPKALSWNFRWAFVAAAAFAAMTAAVLVFQPQRMAKPGVVVTASRPLVPPPAPVVEPPPRPELTAIRHSVTKAVKWANLEPQLIIAANEISAMRRLFSGEITEMPPPFQPQVKEFRTPETAVEPLPQPAAVTIDPIHPIEPLIPAGQ
jgi:hypothetical protein